jgi:hypothetical protein
LLFSFRGKPEPLRGGLAGWLSSGQQGATASALAAWNNEQKSSPAAIRAGADNPRLLKAIIVIMSSLVIAILPFTC